MTDRFERVDDTKAVWKDEALRGRDRIATLERELAEAREQVNLSLTRANIEYGRAEAAEARLAAVASEVLQWADNDDLSEEVATQLMHWHHVLTAALSAPAEPECGCIPGHAHGCEPAEPKEGQ